MNITSKGRYALQIMLDLASLDIGKRKKRQEIADKHKIPLGYMNKIISALKTSGLIECYRGSNGGIKLIKSADNISMWDVIVAVEDKITPVACAAHDKSCSIYDTCLSKDAWTAAFYDIKKVFKNKKLINFIK